MATRRFHALQRRVRAPHFSRTAAAAGGRRSVRPRPRARCLRRRLRRRHQRPPLARDRRAGAARPGQPAAPRRLRLRGQHRRRRRHPHADAGPVPAQGHGAARHHAAARRLLRRRLRVPAASGRGPRTGSRRVRRDRPRGRPAPPRLAGRPDRRSTARRIGGGGGAAVRAGVYRLWRRVRFLGSGDARAFRAQAVRHPQAGRARRRSAGGGESRRARFLHPEPLGEDAHLQRDADRRSDRADVPGSGGSRTSNRRSRSCTSGSARTRSRRGRSRIPIGTSRTTARSTRCAATSTGCARAKGLLTSPLLGDDLKKILPIIREGRQRHRDVRQRPRVPRHDRAVAAARDPDDDSGAVGRARNDVRRAQGLLRIPLVAHGAVGRPGVDRVHRRLGHRRGPRPERPPSVALLRDEGRPRDHGVRGRRARHSAREHS